jgi:hypothetical protein
MFRPCFPMAMRWGWDSVNASGQRSDNAKPKRVFGIPAFPASSAALYDVNQEIDSASPGSGRFLLMFGERIWSDFKIPPDLGSGIGFEDHQNELNSADAFLTVIRGHLLVAKRYRRSCGLPPQ